jgi:transposase-like protein
MEYWRALRAMPPHHWYLACAQFAIIFGDRFNKLSD